MRTPEEDKLKRLLQQAKNTVPVHSSEGVFLQVLETLDKDVQPRLSFRSLRNTGLALLLLVALNAGAWALAAGRKNDDNRLEQQAYLQSYNLNLY